MHAQNRLDGGPDRLHVSPDGTQRLRRAVCLTLNSLLYKCDLISSPQQSQEVGSFVCSFHVGS